MSLRNEIVSFWFWGYRGDLRIKLQAPKVLVEITLCLYHVKFQPLHGELYV